MVAESGGLTSELVAFWFNLQAGVLIALADMMLITCCEELLNTHSVSLWCFLGQSSMHVFESALSFFNGGIGLREYVVQECDGRRIIAFIGC